MNGPHLHLILNHIPILGTAFGFLLLLIGIIKKSFDIKKMGLLFFVIAALITIPVYYSGKASPKIVKELPGVTRPYIHDHAESADISFITVGVLGALALVGLLLSLRAQGSPNWIYLLCFFLSIPVSGSMVYTANLGGQIRHTEIRPDFVPPPPRPTSLPAVH
jgi:hypothetical protein